MIVYNLTTTFKKKQYLKYFLYQLVRIVGYFSSLYNRLKLRYFITRLVKNILQTSLFSFINNLLVCQVHIIIDMVYSQVKVNF